MWQQGSSQRPQVLINYYIVDFRPLPDTAVSYDGGSSVVDNGNDKGGGGTVDAAAAAGGRAGGGEGATSVGPSSAIGPGCAAVGTGTTGTTTLFWFFMDRATIPTHGRTQTATMMMATMAPTLSPPEVGDTVGAWVAQLWQLRRHHVSMYPGLFEHSAVDAQYSQDGFLFVQLCPAMIAFEVPTVGE